MSNEECGALVLVVCSGSEHSIKVSIDNQIDWLLRQISDIYLNPRNHMKFCK